MFKMELKQKIKVLQALRQWVMSVRTAGQSQRSTKRNRKG